MYQIIYGFLNKFECLNLVETVEAMMFSYQPWLNNVSPSGFISPIECCSNYFQFSEEEHVYPTMSFLDLLKEM